MVEAKVVTDRETGRSRGFGFVTYQEATDGEVARQAMDGASLDGRSIIRVNAAGDKPRTGGGGQQRSGVGGGVGGGRGGRSRGRSGGRGRAHDSNGRDD